MVTHEPDIAAHARRVVVLRDGVIASDDRRVDASSTKLGAVGLTHESPCPSSKPSGSPLPQIRVQKLKSFFTLLGVVIGVMFLIAVVSIVEGMSRYMEEDLVGKIIGDEHVRAAAPPEHQRRRRRRGRRGASWRSRPRITEDDVEPVARSARRPATRWAVLET